MHVLVKNRICKGADPKPLEISQTDVGPDHRFTRPTWMPKITNLSQLLLVVYSWKSQSKNFSKSPAHDCPAQTPGNFPPKILYPLVFGRHDDFFKFRDDISKMWVGFTFVTDRHTHPHTQQQQQSYHSGCTKDALRRCSGHQKSVESSRRKREERLKNSGE